MSHPELTIRGVLLPIRLGCSADERLNPQPVEIDLTIVNEAGETRVLGTAKVIL